MDDIIESNFGLKTALEIGLKSSEGQTEKLGSSKNCLKNADCHNANNTELPLLGASSLTELHISNVVNCANEMVCDAELAQNSGGKRMISGDRGMGYPAISNAIEDNKRPGRPKGAKNRSTEEWRKYFFARVHKSPLIMLGELYCKTTAELAEEMGCNRIDALKTQVAAANAVLPYVHQKQPIAIEDNTQSLPAIYINVSQADAMVLQAQANNSKTKAIHVAAITDAEFDEVLASEKLL